MSTRTSLLHIYEREIKAAERSSLTVLAELVKPGARVLDLGCGSGALGRHLHTQMECRLHGVTINESEAALARPNYERVEVADLDQVDLSSMFAGQHFDHIICADVLEHLRDPGRVLQACRALLAEHGNLLISIPNVAYAGLIAELMEGRFTYREEGLLDSTHLRFFTRLSLIEFLTAHQFGIQTFDTIRRELCDSEFRTSFDLLAPAAARCLLTMPDALSYQFIVAARPDTPHVSEVLEPLGAPSHALFSARLYFGGVDGYREERKLDTKGVIGQLRQVLRFQLPPDQNCTSLRLDPADRPGFLHLFRLTLNDAQGAEVWSWHAEQDHLDRLAQQAHHQILFNSPLSSAFSVPLLLYGDDPWIELPVSHVMSKAQGGSLQVELGWPMSADFLCLVDKIKQLGDPSLADKAIRTIQNELSQSQALAQAMQSRLDDGLKELHDTQDRERLLLEQNAALIELRQVQHRRQRELKDLVERVQHDLNEQVRLLAAVRSSPVFRLTRPLAKLKASLLSKRNSTGQEAPSDEIESSHKQRSGEYLNPVDIIVPVYKGLDDTQRCIDSVLQHPQRTPWRLIVINDCSPEPELTSWLRLKASNEPRLILLENEENLGFVGTVNRGMSYSEQHDVLLLNSDTEVANDWLDRLVRAAHAHGRVGTVTPFSNNATICSYPRFCQSNALPPGYDTASLDALFSRALSGLVVDVPTGVGFCMYIRRDCLHEVGLFDVATFGKGYGEENDFCRRAAAAGWRNLHALDTFVLHSGGVSFGASKNARELAAMRTLQRLHPDYDGLVHTFIQQDPARQARLAIDQLRLTASGLPVVLAVMHNRGGGTVRHAQELAAHLAQKAIFFMLRPTGAHEVALEWLDANEGFALTFTLPSEFEDLVDLLRDLGVCHLHYHHLLGHSADILHLPDRLKVSYDFTAHDYYSVCPQISLTTEEGRYCGETGSDQCAGCIERRPAPGNGTIQQWRSHHGEFLKSARHVFAPSLDTAKRLAQYIPGCDFRVAPHTDLTHLQQLTVPSPKPLASTAPLKVVVIGALSAIKGADLLDAVATASASRGALTEFHLLGYAYHTLRTQPKSHLTVHGAYDEGDLPKLLEWLKPDLVWFPALWPETYSYTLSAALAAGLPILAANIGAFNERLQGRPWSWTHDWDLSADAMLDLLLRIREDHFATASAPPTCIRPTTPNTASSWASSQPVDAWRYEDTYLKLEARAPQLISAERLLHFWPGRPHLGPGEVRPQLHRKTTPVRRTFRQKVVALPGVLTLARQFPLSWRNAVKRKLGL